MEKGVCTNGPHHSTSDISCIVNVLLHAHTAIDLYFKIYWTKLRIFSSCAFPPFWMNKQNVQNASIIGTLKNETACKQDGMKWRADNGDLHIGGKRWVYDIYVWCEFDNPNKVMHCVESSPFRPHDVRPTSQILWLRKHIPYCAWMLFSWIYVVGKQIVMNFLSYDISAIVFTIWITYV